MQKTSRANRTRAVSLVLLVCLAAAGLAVASPVGAAQPPDLLDARRRGADALRAAQDRIGAVAAVNRIPPQRLSEVLSRDPSTGLDRKGRLFYVEERRSGGATLSQGSLSAGAPAAAGDPLTLHSNPGSPRVIYLDFDGATLSNSVWNDEYANSPSVDMPGYTLDGQPAFSATELENITNIWLRVSEDFAPFDVDVTTEQPAAEALTRADSLDPTYGTTVLITRDTMGICGCGGWAYYNAFDEIGTPERYYQPALVFFESLNSGNEKTVAEAASHEAGHNLGLHHDGTSSTSYYRGHGSGATGWAPIMGSAYTYEVTQWSKGEYPNANNKEDDLAIIASHGAVPRTDDAGGSPAAALPLAGSLAGSVFTVEQAGRIERTADVDMYKLDTSGTVSLSITPAPRGANLDIKATIYRSDGTLAPMSGNPANDPAGLTAAISGTLPGGSYILAVEGTGDTSPLPGYSNYASLGPYTITGTLGAVTGSVAGPPVNVSAVAGNGSATVSFSPPASDGGNTISSYEALSSPGGRTATGAAGPLTVTGLTNGTTYTFTVRAINAAGAGPYSTPSNAVTPAVPPPSLSVADVSITEGNSGTKTLRLTINRAGNTAVVSTVKYSTASTGSATAGVDYVTVAPTTVSFAKGVTSKAISVTIREDRTVEPDETFLVNLSAPTAATISRGTATATIRNDD